MANKILKGSIFGVLQHVLTAVLTFISIPIFIKTLGIEQFGIYSLLTVLGNLNIIANLGLNTTLVKSLSSQGKSQQSDYDIIVTILFVITISLPLTIIGLFSSHFVINDILNIKNQDYDKAYILYTCMLIANVVLLIGQTLVAILESQGRFHITNSFQFIYNTCYWLGAIVAVKLGYGLNGVGLTALLASIIWIVLLGYNCLNYWGKVSIHGLKGNFKSTLNKQLSHGLKIFSGGLLGMLIEPVTKILTGNLIGIKEVGYLEIAYKLRMQFWGLIMKALAPIFPLISSNKNIKDSKNVILNTQIRLITFIIPLIFIVINTLPLLLTLWLGESSPELTNTVLLLTISYVISSIAIPAYFAQLTFYPASIIYAHISNLVLNLGITYTLYPKIGFTAIILGSSIAFLLSNQLNIYYINIRALKSIPSLKNTIKIIFIVLIIFIGSYLFKNIIIISSIIYATIYVFYITILALLSYILFGYVSIKPKKYLKFNNIK